MHVLLAVLNADRLYVEGKIRYRYYDDKKGQRRFITEVYADNMELLTPRPTTNSATETATTTSSSNTTMATSDDEDKLPF